MTDSKTKQAFPHCSLLGVPERYKEKSLNNFEGFLTEKALAIEAIKLGQSVFLTGACGTGKSHLGIGLLKVALHLGESTPVEVPDDVYWHVSERNYRFLAAVDFFLELKATFGEAPGNEEQTVDFYSRCTCLLIDDVGAEKVSDWSRQMFYTLIDRRYRECKQTIITSNLSLAELARHIDTRITSRILEMGIKVDLGKVDYRKKAFEGRKNV